MTVMCIYQPFRLANLNKGHVCVTPIGDSLRMRMISCHTRRFWLDTLLSAYILVEESCSVSKLCVFNTAYIGLFDRSQLLHLSSNQVELALKM